MGWIGTPELVIILIVALIIFGPKSLPKIGSALGKGIREFKGAANSVMEAADLDEEPSKVETKDKSKHQALK